MRLMLNVRVVALSMVLAAAASFMLLGPAQAACDCTNAGECTDVNTCICDGCCGITGARICDSHWNIGTGTYTSCGWLVDPSCHS